VAFAEKGVHLMVEKPMALTVADCRKIIDAAQRNNVKLQVTQTQRYMDYAVSARRAVESGMIGAPIHIQMSMCWDYFTGKRSGWQVDHAMSGGGVTMNPFIHMIDFVRYVSLSEVNEYHGAVGYHKPGYTIEGDVECFARFENGATAFVYVDGYGEYKFWGGLITCEKGVLLIDVDGKRLEIRRHGSPSESIGVGRGWVQRPDGRKTHSGYLAHVEEMRDAIEKGGPLKSDGLNGMKNVEIAEGILRAAGAPGYV
jgi:predicted dehydrogenase